MSSSANTGTQLVFHDAHQQRVDDVFAYPVRAGPGGPQPTGDSPTTLSWSQLCTLPSAKVAKILPPSLIEPDHGGCRRRMLNHWGIDGGHRAVWDTLVNAQTGLCMALDDQTLADRAIVPVPISGNTSSLDPWVQHRIVPLLKHVLESRNHSAASLPIFANVTVRPLHKRLRLGICTAFPPIGSPCSLSAVDDATGTVAEDWVFPGHYENNNPVKVSLARPASAFSSMVGPDLNTWDRVNSFPPPFPFLTSAAINNDPPRYWTSYKAWSVPLVRCVRNSSSPTGGVVVPLLVSGPCTSNRDCLSGTCHAATKTCADEHATGAFIFSPLLATHTNTTRFLTYPTDVPSRRMTDALAYGYWPETWMYYVPVISVSAVIGAIGLLTVAWIKWHGVAKRVRSKWVGWRTTTDRDTELKPVSGHMVADLGDDRAVQEDLEQLPVYVDCGRDL